MASLTRRARRKISQQFSKLQFIRQDKFLKCEIMEDEFGNNPDQKVNWRGDIILKWMVDPENSPKFETGVREYQRFKVKTVLWQQTIVEDVLLNGIRVQEVVIRVIETVLEDGVVVFSYEVIDGQQRLTAFIEYMKGYFPIFVEGEEMYIVDLAEKKPALHQELLRIRFGALFYEKVEPSECSIIFKKVNDQTDINPQEDRNATFGPYPTYIRERTYYGIEGFKRPFKHERHPLFDISSIPNGNNVKKNVLSMFPKLDISKQRMEQLEWFSELIHMHERGYKTGMTNDTHSEWVSKFDTTAEVYDDRKAENLLRIAWKLMKSATAVQREKEITKMMLQIMTLWYNELEDGTGMRGFWKIKAASDFVNGFLEVVERWSVPSTTDTLRKGWIVEGKPDVALGPMKDLFGGKNASAIQTIIKILYHEIELDSKQFGILQLDPKRKFDGDDIYRKWKEQGKIDAKSKKPLDFDDAQGDHVIPRSKGIEVGGTTTYDNLQVISSDRNLMKGNSPEERSY